MSDFKDKMHQIRFLLELHPGSAVNQTAEVVFLDQTAETEFSVFDCWG